MVIYGSAIIAFCMLVGMLIGEEVGMFIGVGTNVGGVGFAMLLMLLLTNYVFPADKMNLHTKQGITFWREMYIPVVVAISASQNVVQAVSGGMVAILAGVLAVCTSMALVPLLNRLGGGKELDV